jgi:hypothetical protein
MKYSTQTIGSAAQPDDTVLNRPKTFFYPIGWLTVACVFSWFVWMVVG